MIYTYSSKCCSSSSDIQIDTNHSYNERTFKMAVHFCIAIFYFWLCLLCPFFFIRFFTFVDSDNINNNNDDDNYDDDNNNKNNNNNDDDDNKQRCGSMTLLILAVT